MKKKKSKINLDYYRNRLDGQSAARIYLNCSFNWYINGVDKNYIKKANSQALIHFSKVELYDADLYFGIGKK